MFYFFLSRAWTLPFAFNFMTDFTLFDVSATNKKINDEKQSNMLWILIQIIVVWSIFKEEARLKPAQS